MTASPAPDLVQLDREGEVFVLTLTNGENRWNTTLVRQIDAALDEVERSTGPAALVTASADPKFFSNGLDLEWLASRGEHPGGDRRIFAEVAMALFARVMTLPVPTVCAVGGHAFGAGFMVALCHDVRIMRADRGFLCANEIELGMSIPEPELALFRHKLSMSAFHQTVILAKRWGGQEALDAGVVQQLAGADELRATAVETAAGLARLARHRDVMGWMKERLYGEQAAINRPEGPAHMLRTMHHYAEGPNHLRG
jgi:enoyl-CoA hydratase/carnithine racemase